MDDKQRVVDRLLEDLQTDPRSAPRALTPRATVRIGGGGPDRRATGEGAGDLLVEAIEEDPAWRGRQVRGDVHPMLDTTLVVLSFELEDGTRADRVLLVRFRGEQLDEVVVYRTPLAGEVLVG